MSLENLKLNPQQPQQTTAHLVHVSQVVTETAFLKRSGQLQMTLSSGNFVDFCEAKIAAAQNEFERTIWSFLKVGVVNHKVTLYVNCGTMAYCRKRRIT